MNPTAKENREQSRRSFFGSSVKLVGVGAVAATLGAQTTKPPSDVDLLNYALTLENLESAFYVQGLTKLTAADFGASSLLKNLISSTVLDGSASVAGDGKPLTYLWKPASGGKTAAILNANTVNPQVQFGEGFGYYNFELTVTDSTGATAKDQTSVFYAGR